MAELDDIHRRLDSIERLQSDSNTRAQLNTERIIRIDEWTHGIDKLAKVFVTRSEFDPIRAIVYGIVSVTLLAVIAALLYLVVKT